jgi:hypothetical protein
VRGRLSDERLVHIEFRELKGAADTARLIVEIPEPELDFGAFGDEFRGALVGSDVPEIEDEAIVIRETLDQDGAKFQAEWFAVLAAQVSVSLVSAACPEAGAVAGSGGVLAIEDLTGVKVDVFASFEGLDEEGVDRCQDGGRRNILGIREAGKHKTRERETITHRKTSLGNREFISLFNPRKVFCREIIYEAFA